MENLGKTQCSTTNQETVGNLRSHRLDGNQHIAVLALSLLEGDTADLNNWIEIALWVSSIAGVFSMKKWGAAFAIFTLSTRVLTTFLLRHMD